MPGIADTHSPLLEQTRELHCANNEESAAHALQILADSRLPGINLPSEEATGIASNRPTQTDTQPAAQPEPSAQAHLYAATFDIVLDTVMQAAEKFPGLRMQAERTLLGWDYCQITTYDGVVDLMPDTGQLHTGQLHTGQLQRTTAHHDAPLDWRGFKRLGFLGATSNLFEFSTIDLTSITTTLPAEKHWRVMQHTCLETVATEQQSKPTTDASNLFSRTAGPTRVQATKPHEQPPYPFHWEPQCDIPYTAAEKERDAEQRKISADKKSLSMARSKRLDAMKIRAVSSSRLMAQIRAQRLRLDELNSQLEKFKQVNEQQDRDLPQQSRRSGSNTAQPSQQSTGQRPVRDATDKENTTDTTQIKQATAELEVPLATKQPDRGLDKPKATLHSKNRQRLPNPPTTTLLRDQEKSKRLNGAKVWRIILSRALATHRESTAIRPPPHHLLATETHKRLTPTRNWLVTLSRILANQETAAPQSPVAPVKAPPENLLAVASRKRLSTTRSGLVLQSRMPANKETSTPPTPRKAINLAAANWAVVKAPAQHLLNFADRKRVTVTRSWRVILSRVIAAQNIDQETRARNLLAQKREKTLRGRNSSRNLTSAKIWRVLLSRNYATELQEPFWQSAYIYSIAELHSQPALMSRRRHLRRLSRHNPALLADSRTENMAVQLTAATASHGTPGRTRKPLAPTIWGGRLTGLQVPQTGLAAIQTNNHLSTASGVVTDGSEGSVAQIPPFHADSGSKSKRKYHGWSGSVSLNNRIIDVAEPENWSITTSFAYKPIRSSYYFARTGITWRDSDDPITYYWGLGYNDWHKDTWSFEINHWGPLKPGDGLDIDNAIGTVAYKFKSDFLAKNKLSSSLALSKSSGNEAAFTGMLAWAPKENWFVRTLITQSVDGGKPTWAYGFGYNNWRKNTFSLEYNNWGLNELPEDNFKENGLVTLGWKWEH